MLTSISKWKGFVIKSWHIGKEHIHLYTSIPPKYSVILCIVRSEYTEGQEFKLDKKEDEEVATGEYMESWILCNHIGY